MHEAARLRAEVGGEQCRADDLQRHPHHGVVDVDDRAGRPRPPVREQPLPRGGDVPADRVQRAGMERRLDQPAAAAPDRPVAGQQALAGDQRERVVLDGALAVGPVVALQHAQRSVGVVDEQHPLPGDRELHHVAELGRALHEEGQRVGTHLPGVLEHPAPRGQHSAHEGTLRPPGAGPYGGDHTYGRVVVRTRRPSRWRMGRLVGAASTCRWVKPSRRASAARQATRAR